jgi:hypothetical protein
LPINSEAVPTAGELDLAIAKGLPGESVVEGSTG